ncbi:MAG: hypothetical protein Fues2KO_17630 [Fuerstiella sp.]
MDARRTNGTFRRAHDVSRGVYAANWSDAQRIPQLTLWARRNFCGLTREFARRFACGLTGVTVLVNYSLRSTLMISLSLRM